LSRNELLKRALQDPATVAVVYEIWEEGELCDSQAWKKRIIRKFYSLTSTADQYELLAPWQEVEMMW